MIFVCYAPTGTTRDWGDKIAPDEPLNQPRIILECALKEFLSVEELSQYLGIKKSSLYSMVEKREIPFYKIGRLVRFKKADIDAWVDGFKFEVINPQAEARKIITRGRPEISRIIKKNVAQAKGLIYTPKYGRPDKVKDLGKEVSNGTL